MIKLLKGDCLVRMKEIPDKSIDCVITDCPYKIVAGGCSTKNFNCSGVLSMHNPDIKSGKLFGENDILFSDWLPDIYRVLKDNTHCYIMINGRNLKELQMCAEQAGFIFQNLLVWDKGNKTPNRYYMQQVEFVLMLRKGNAKTITNAGTGNLLSFKNNIGNKIHPTEKPVDLIDVFVKNSTQPGDWVLDPFMGAGSSGVSCLHNNRHFIGIEKDDKYFSIAKDRITKHYNELKKVSL